MFDEEVDINTLFGNVMNQNLNNIMIDIKSKKKPRFWEKFRIFLREVAKKVLFLVDCPLRRKGGLRGCPLRIFFFLKM